MENEISAGWQCDLALAVLPIYCVHQIHSGPAAPWTPDADSRQLKT